MVFDGLIRKGALGGFGLENLGDVSKLNGTVKLADSFIPKEITPQPVQQPVQPVQQPVQPVQPVQKPESMPKFFGDINDNTIDREFFGKILPPKVTKTVRKGIPNEVNFFGKIPKPKTDTPLIGSLDEGISFYDSAFGNQNALKKGRGFDRFIGDIDIERLSRGLPDSAVPKSGVFADKKFGVDSHAVGIQETPDLSRMSNVGLLPNPIGFNGEVNVSENVSENTLKRKAGRPFGSLGKKKRQAKKIQEKMQAKNMQTKNEKRKVDLIDVGAEPKRKKRNELTKARLSLLEEKSRLAEGGAPRNAFQSKYFNENDFSFRDLFT